MKSKLISRRITAVCIILALTLCRSASSAKCFEHNNSVSLSSYPTNEILVKCRNNITSSELASLLPFDASVKEEVYNENYFLVTLDNKIQLEETLHLFENNKMIEYMQPNYIYSISSDGTEEPEFSKQWGLSNDGTFPANGITSVKGIDLAAPDAWAEAKSRRETIVALIDTGVDFTHPDLKDSMWTNSAEIPDDGVDNDNNGKIDDIHGWNFYNNDNILCSSDLNEDKHGTHCAGTIAASHNGIGIAGIASGGGVKIMSLKCLGGGDGTGTASDVAEAIYYAEKMGASICNLSCGMLGNADKAIGDAISKSSMLFVVAAGNGDGKSVSYNIDQIPSYPSCYPYNNIITVANIRPDGILHPLSNYGTNSVDIAAPGTFIYSTITGGRYGYLSGTSMAAPMVTGVAALLYSQYAQITPLQVRELILNTASPLESLIEKVSTGGMVNAYTALTVDAVTLLDLDIKPPVIKTSTAKISDSNKKKLLLTITDSKSPSIQVRYAKGVHKLGYFKGKNTGTSIQLSKTGKASILCSSSGTYTIYAMDASGNVSLKTVTVTVPKSSK